MCLMTWRCSILSEMLLAASEGWTALQWLNKCSKHQHSADNEFLREACRQSQVGHIHFWQLEDVCWQVFSKQELITQLLQVRDEAKPVNYHAWPETVDVLFILLPQLFPAW